MPRPIQATIKHAALRHNYGLAKQHATAHNPAAKIWAIVKADAYGHGLLRVANALADLADGFALLDVEAAISLREAGFSQPILLLEGFFDADDLALCLKHQITPCVHNFSQLHTIALELTKRPLPPNSLPIYVKLNTGMNRFGFQAPDLPALSAQLAGLPAVSVRAIMMHFADADNPILSSIDAPYQAFTAMLKALQTQDFLANKAPPQLSLANSAALLRHPKTVSDWVRPGIMLYGASPFTEVSAAAIKLQAVMTLSSKIIAIQKISAGEAVGYGGTFVAKHAMRIGIVACGYADGYPRQAPLHTPIWVHGARSTLAARVAMDTLMCDLTHLPEASLGSDVELWGANLPADEVAAAAGTVSYELFCALAKRVRVQDLR